jgi:hypothetical protein
MRILETVVSAALFVSAMVGAIILKTDAYLWAAAPSHAYGLVVFVAVDLGLAAAVWRVTKLAILGTALMGAVQFAAMAGDVFMGGPAGLPQSAWQQYLLGDAYFVALLGIQLVVVAVAVLGIVHRRAMTLRTLQH